MTIRTWSGSLSALVLMGLVAGACSSSSSAPADPGGGVTGTCYSDDPTCGLPSSPCLAMVDNTSKDKYSLRVSQIQTKAPAALAAPAVQKIVLTKNVPFNLKACNQFGTGRISWLFDVDATAGTFTLGGGPPITDASKIAGGTCLLDFTDPKSNLPVKPATVNGKVNADGSLTADPIDSVNLPIFLDDAGTSYVLLPLHKLVVDGAKLSADHNCFGKFNGDTLSVDNACLPDEAKGEFAWTNAGTFNAYITIEESDTVWVKDFSESLCVLLSQDSTHYKDANGYCVRENGKVTLVGDWDSATNTAGGAKDAFHLVADFAASAITVNGTSSSLAFDCAGAK